MGWLAVQLYLACQLMEAVSPHEGATGSLTFCKTVHFCKQGNLIRYYLHYNTYKSCLMSVFPGYRMEITDLN